MSLALQTGVLQQASLLSSFWSGIKYGRLYNYPTANSAIAPSGWAVPTDAQWTALTNYLINTYSQINSSNISMTLRSCRTNDTIGFPCQTAAHPYWMPLNDYAYLGTNDFNFDVVGAASRVPTGTWNTLGAACNFWTKTAVNGTHAKSRQFLPYTGVIDVMNSDKAYGFSIRLVRTATTPEQQLADGTLLDPIFDYEGNKYPTVKIGAQVWTTRNWASTCFSNGTPITKKTFGAGSQSNPEYYEFDNNPDYV